LSSPGIISKEDMEAIFGSTEQLILISKELIEKLEALDIRKPQTLMCGEIFLQMLPQLKIFQQYCSLSQIQTSTLSKLEESNKAFKKFLEDAKEICNSENLESLIVKPLQRICRYPLLLKELESTTDKTHPDYNNLVQAITKIKEIVSETNTNKHLADSLSKTTALQQLLLWQNEEDKNKFTQTMKTQSLLFIKEGEVRDYRKRPLFCFLFSKFLLITRQKKKNYEVMDMFIKGETVVWNRTEKDGVPTPDIEDKGFTLMKRDSKQSACKITLTCETDYDKQEWMSEIGANLIF